MRQTAFVQRLAKPDMPLGETAGIFAISSMRSVEHMGLSALERNVIVSRMNSRFSARLLVLIVAIAGTASLTLWGVHYSWQQIRTLEETLTSTSLESFRLAEEFQQRLVRLNNSMHHYATRRDPAAWKEFEAASNLLDRWMDEPKFNLTSDPERKLFTQLNQAYDEYQNVARRLHASVESPSTLATNIVLIDGFEQSERQLLELGTLLAKAHRDAEQSFLEKANTSLGHLRMFLFASVGVLLCLTGGLGWVIYLDFIAPLRVRLVEREALLQRQEKLATLGTLAAGIAHEIRNPLTSIKARLYTLGKHIKGNEAGVADASVIGTEMNRLERIVQEVLQFARPTEPRLKIVRADALLYEVQNLMAATLEKNGVQLFVEADSEQVVSMDVSLMKQVLINLVRNAAEAINRDGKISLRVRHAHTRLNGRMQDVAILEVADNGRGIPPDVEKRLFDPFFSTKEGGMGLGLSITARIVEKHGGALQYQTQVGHGTTFGVVLPVAAGDTAKKLPHSHD